MTTLARPHAGDPCHSARLRASLALDGVAGDDFDRLHVERHLARCPDCAAVVASMREATAVLRRAPLVHYRCRIDARRAPRLPWANVAVAALMIAVAVVVVPQSSDPPRPGALPPGRAESPPPLPIGQRSAVDDFLPRAIT